MAFFPIFYSMKFFYIHRMKEQREVAANERQDELVEYQKNNRDLSKEVELLKQSSQDSKVGHVIGNQGYKCCCIM